MTYGGFPVSKGTGSGFAVPNTTVVSAPAVGAGKGFPFAKGFDGFPFGKAGCGGVPFGKGYPASAGSSKGFAVPNATYATVPW